jgi:hypothetical protein
MNKNFRLRQAHPYEWAWEAVAGQAGYELKPMFGGRALYRGGLLQLYFTAKEEPWRGVLLCTDQARHAALQESFPALKPHPVLPKWLYLSEEAEDFEALVLRFVACVRAADPRLGVSPKPKKPRRKRLRVR